MRIQSESQNLDAIVDQIAVEMKKKLHSQKVHGWRGWEEWLQFYGGGERVCPNYENELRERFELQLTKPILDPVDIANFAAFLFAARNAKP
ncbi:hypothetical protein M0R72_10735 [Candidatus Pacearchaeota archaeon]|nr:hypothetical protein [Candidatus Pacearchaeota archaeon]